MTDSEVEVVRQIGVRCMEGNVVTFDVGTDDISHFETRATRYLRRLREAFPDVRVISRRNHPTAKGHQLITVSHKDKYVTLPE